jgi:hypothetical protein
VQHSVPYVHTKNGLAESLIKRIKMIARLLLYNCKFPITCWGHEVLHVADLIHLQPTAYHSTYLLYLVRGNALSISHLRKFGCAVYAPISPMQLTVMGPYRKMDIYVGYHSSSIIKYKMVGTKCQEINSDDKFIISSDPRTQEIEPQVQKIINL